MWTINDQKMANGAARAPQKKSALGSFLYSSASPLLPTLHDPFCVTIFRSSCIGKNAPAEPVNYF